MDNENRGMKSWGRNGVGAKLVFIGIIALLLLIPASMAENLISERENRKAHVSDDVGSKWGREQTVTGPVLQLPYLKEVINTEGHYTHVRDLLYLLPDHLDIDSQVEPQKRSRGIYEAVVYSSSIRMKGNFDLSQIKERKIDVGKIMFDQATVLLGISDMKGIKERIVAEVNGATIEMNPGFQETILPRSVAASINGLSAQGKAEFDFSLKLSGTAELRFVPAGRETVVKMKSAWDSPSFNGAFLPTSRQVSTSGFEAEWNVLHFNRDLPQVWTDRSVNFSNHAFGVSFIIPADIYQQATRTAKYAILFIGFTFSAFFIAEILNRKRIHPVQYLLIGFALVLFYVLLISISEHLNFAAAYLLATVATIAMIATYSISVLRSRHMGGIVAAILAGLYSYMYVVLNLEDYSLIMGAVGLAVVLSFVMYLTRSIDWYAASPEIPQ